MRRKLRWESDLPYYTSGQVQLWHYAPYANRSLNMVVELRSAMDRIPFLLVMVANGYYDFATPFGATEYTYHHLGSDRSYRDRVTLTYYEAGHMMYIHTALLAQLKRDIATFIDATKEGR